jgi:hypothetical protein
MLLNICVWNAHLKNGIGRECLFADMLLKFIFSSNRIFNNWFKNLHRCEYAKCHLTKLGFHILGEHDKAFVVFAQDFHLRSFINNYKCRQVIIWEINLNNQIMIKLMSGDYRMFIQIFESTKSQRLIEMMVSGNINTIVWLYYSSNNIDLRISLYLRDACMFDRIELVKIFISEHRKHIFLPYLARSFWI